MATLADAAEFAQDPALHGPLTVAVATAAVNIMNEDPNTNHHATRVALARHILGNPGAYADRFRYVVATNPTIVAHPDIESALGDLQYVVDSVYNAMAGIATEVPDEPTDE